MGRPEPTSSDKMRRILVFSLLSACVLGLPGEGNDYDYNLIRKEERIEHTLRITDSDYDKYDYYDEESYDNCTLASPIYYPLRRSEIHYKRFR